MKKHEKLFAAEKLRKQYDNCRSNLLLVVIFTVINCALIFFDSDTMFLFSATIPYFSLLLGILSEFYEVFIASIIVAAVCVILYFLCWIFSKKHYGWLIAALVFFVIDTLLLICLYLLMSDSGGIFDFLVHVWVLYYLITGIVCGVKLKKMPEEVPVEGENSEEGDSDPDSQYLYMADYTVKAKILLEATVGSYRICYRRVKKTNELIVNDRVYDTYEAFLEKPHTLIATLDGHIIEAGIRASTSLSFIDFDNENVKKKVRLI